MFRGFNVNNHAAEDFRKVREICEAQTNCGECPMVGGQPLVIEDRKLFCETGKNKKKKED